jgi:uncharacterized protein YaaW (UPF0174 family)
MLRYTKLALLMFGAGLLLGLAAVSTDIRLLGPLASGLMAAGLVLDWRHAATALRQTPPPRRKRGRPARPRARKAKRAR